MLKYSGIIIGSISAIVGLSVIIASGFFLSYTSRTKCNVTAIFRHEQEAQMVIPHGFTFYFHPSLNLTELKLRGECGWLVQDQGQDPELAEEPVEANIITGNENEGGEVEEPGTKTEGTTPYPNIDIRGGGMAEEAQHNVTSQDKCTVLCGVPKFKDCAGVGIGTGILQIILASFYILWKKKTIPIMSLLFWSNFFVFLCHLTAFTLILHTAAGSHEFTKDHYEIQYETQFCIVLGLNCALLIGILTFLCLTADPKDYYDHCGEKVAGSGGYKGQTNTGISMSSTDRLN